MSTFEGFDQRFGDVVHNLLNKMVLVIKETAWRIVEVEVYFHGGIHKDPFTHCDEMQSQSGMWYFHRKGNSYKGGTFKGLDISIGTPGQAHGGILLRSIENEANGELVEGPCRVVDTILRLTGHDSITTFVDKNTTLDVAKCPELHLHPQDIGTRAILRGPRYGLTLRAAAAAAFYLRPYRYTTVARRLTKQRVGFALHAHSQGSPESPKALLNVAAGEWQRCLEAFALGKTASVDKFVGVVLATNSLLAEAYGVFHGLPMPDPSTVEAGPPAHPLKRPAGSTPAEDTTVSGKKKKAKKAK
eukprot:EG_transcript_18781